MSPFEGVIVARSRWNTHAGNQSLSMGVIFPHGQNSF